MNHTERRLRWIGGPTVELKLGGFTLLTDPMFSTGPEAFFMNGHPSTGSSRAAIARAGALPPVDPGSVDLIVVSHLHSDHFDREATARLSKSVPVVAPAAQAARLESWGFETIARLKWWDSYAREGDGERIDILAVPARHSANAAANEMLGIVNGYLIRHAAGEDEFRLYWTGDTVWFDQLRDARRRIGQPHALVPHIGAVGRDGPWGRMTMDAVEAVKLMRLFAPAVTIPIHHHTFSHYVEPVDALVTLLAGSPDAACLRVLTEGDSLELET